MCIFLYVRNHSQQNNISKCESTNIYNISRPLWLEVGVSDSGRISSSPNRYESQSNLFEFSWWEVSLLTNVRSMVLPRCLIDTVRLVGQPFYILGSLYKHATSKSMVTCVFVSHIYNVPYRLNLNTYYTEFYINTRPNLS